MKTTNWLGFQWACLSAGLFSLWIAGCQPQKEQKGVPTREEEHVDEKDLKDPVPLWENGKPGRSIDASTAQEHGYVVIDLGDSWVPYVFSNYLNENGEVVEQDYEKVYLALARGEYPDNYHGHRAKEDKYLELYGIPPTITLLRQRYKKYEETSCINTLDLSALHNFKGMLSFEQSARTVKERKRFDQIKPQVETLMRQANVTDIAALPSDGLDDDTKKMIEDYKIIAPNIAAIRATQERLVCEGYMAGYGKWEPGVFDWATHRALADFERRHRIFGWAFIGRDTLPALQSGTLELERRDLIRVMTERAMHQMGVIEDSSLDNWRNTGSRPMYENAQGQRVEVPNLEKELQNNLVAAFALQTPQSAYAWLTNLGDLSGSRRVAIRAPKLPDYYSSDMKLSVEIDRGDVWYEFPFDADGIRRFQPVTHRPRTTLFVTWKDQKIPLARYGTTIGGWRTEFVENLSMWKYKNSPDGLRVWKHIASAPVWIPPDTTPPKDLLKRVKKDIYEINYHEMGPSYASAYGLVAAYHRKFARGRDGIARLGGDEGIRSHGSVDYMSIMRQFSHGCHRLHNHLAVRLFSFVLKHKPHRRLGYMPMDYRREFEFEEKKYEFQYKRGGYFFELNEDIEVNVLPGRILGAVKDPIEGLIPKYDEEQMAYVMPDGMWVSVDRWGHIAPRAMPPEILAALQAKAIATGAPMPGTEPMELPTEPSLVLDPAAPSTPPEQILPNQPTLPSAAGPTEEEDEKVLAPPVAPAPPATRVPPAPPLPSR